jgi:hypothetical protein
MYGLFANSVRDIQTKVRDDPLLAFKRQEQAALEAMMKNPIKVARIKEKKKKRDRSERSSRSRERRLDPKKKSEGNYEENDDGKDRRDARRDDRDRGYNRDGRDRSFRKEDHDRDYRSSKYDDDRERRDYRKNDYRDERSDGHRGGDSRDSGGEDSLRKLEELKKNAQAWKDERAERVSTDRRNDEEEARRDESDRLKRSQGTSFASEMGRKILGM